MSNEKSGTELVVLCAMENEVRLARKVFGDGVDVRCTGIGKVNAAMGVCGALRDNAGLKAVVSFGCCGGLKAEQRQGDVITSKRVSYWDVYCGEPNEKGQVQGEPLWFESDERLVEAFAGASKWVGDMITGDSFYSGGAAGDAVGVDMETAAIAQCCRRFGLGWVSVRVISDVICADREGAFRNFWEEVEKGAVELPGLGEAMDKALKGVAQ